MLMNGSWHIYRHGERWQQPRFNMRIVLENEPYIAVGFQRARGRDAHRRIRSPATAEFPLPNRDVLSPDFDRRVRPLSASPRIAMKRSATCCSIRK